MRLPLATDLKARVGTPDKDARVKNGIIEIRGESSVVRQRPGVSEALATELGLYAQGGMMFGDYLVYVSNDILLGLSDFNLQFGFGLDTLNSVIYSGSTSYDVGDVVIGDDGEPWYPVQPVSGIPPAYTSAAYPYWSKYKNLPSGTHPTVSRTTTGPTFSYPGGDVILGATSIVISVGASVFGTIIGSLVQEGIAPNPSLYKLFTYSNYGTTSLTNGYYNTYTGVNTTVVSAITDHPTYLAAQDYARSVVV